MKIDSSTAVLAFRVQCSIGSSPVCTAVRVKTLNQVDATRTFEVSLILCLTDLQAHVR